MKKLSGFIVCSLMAIFWGCDDSEAYLKHKLEYEKAGNCSDLQPGISVVANTIGERYVLQECLSSSYNGSYTVLRKGDTVDVMLPKASGPSSLYKITLDINTRPEYKFLTVNGETFPIKLTRY